MQPGSGSLTGQQCWRHACINGHGILSSAISLNSQTGFHPIRHRKGGELPQTCQIDRKKVNFPQNLITYNPCIQICVFSHSLNLRTVRLGVTTPAFAFSPTENKAVVPVGLQAAMTTEEMR